MRTITNIKNNLSKTHFKLLIFALLGFVFSPSSMATAIGNNATITNISGAAGSSIIYSIDVPAGASNLSITTSGIYPDADLYVAFNSVPTTSSWGYRSWSSSSNESVMVSTPYAGTYNIMIHGYSAYSGLTLKVSYTPPVSTQPPPDTTLTNPSTIPNLSGAVGSEINFSIDVPAGASNLSIAITGTSGDADLYVKFGSAPTLYSFDFRPYIGGSNETVTIPAPSVGTYYIMIRGYSAYSGVTLNVSFVEPVATVIPPDPNGFLQFLNKSAPRNNEDANAGDAYYRAIDPQNRRLTLDAFKVFNSLSDAENAVYVNDADLGFGRRMYLTAHPDGSVASCVENFAPLVNGVPNVDASAPEKLALAKEGDPNKVIATVCMEYSGTPGTGTTAGALIGRKYVKFFSYGGGGVRISQADLDGRGLKTQPGLCNICHGGQGNSLVNGEYPDNGDTGAQFLPWDLETFKYDTSVGFRRQDLEPIFKRFNQGVLATYPEPAYAINEFEAAPRAGRPVFQRQDAASA